MTRLRVAGAICALMLAAVAPSKASAADLAALIPGLADKDFAAKIAAVEQVAATGDPRAVPVLEAMLAGRLAEMAAWRSPSNVAAPWS